MVLRDTPNNSKGHAGIFSQVFVPVRSPSAQWPTCKCMIRNTMQFFLKGGFPKTVRAGILWRTPARFSDATDVA